MPEGQKKPSAEGRSPPQELEVGPRSGPYLLVLTTLRLVLVFRSKLGVPVGRGGCATCAHCHIHPAAREGGGQDKEEN